MFKRIKHLNKLCIAIIFSAIALAIAIGLVAISVLKNQEFDDPLRGFTGEYEVEVIPFIPPESESESTDDGGNGGNNGDNGDDLVDNMSYKVFADAAGPLYLRTGSYGNYINNTWSDAVPYTDLIEEKYPASFLTVRQMEESGISMNYRAVTIVSQDSMQILPEYMSTKYVVTAQEEYLPWIPANDVDPSGIRGGRYGVCAYDLDCNNVILSSYDTLSKYEEYELAYRNFVYENYLEIDPALEDYLLGIAEAQNFDPADPEIVIKITEYLGETTEYSDEKMLELDAEENVIYSFLEEYKSGVCRHYAATATMMLRALGIPARYTYGYRVVSDGETLVQVGKQDSHAWVEVYVDGLGWKMAEVTKALQTPPGDIEELPVLKIKPKAVEKFYDGTPLAAIDEIVFLKDNSTSGFAMYEALGYTYDVDVTGITTDPGKAPSLISSFTIYDPDGVVVYSNTDSSVENQFNVVFEEGVMHVYVGVIQLSSGNKIGNRYDAQGVSMALDNSCIYTLVDGEIIENHEIVLEEITEDLPVTAKNHPYKFTARAYIDDGNGGEFDVTNWYKFISNFGTIEILRREVTITTASDTWNYDEWNGEDILTNGEYSCSGLVEGHQLSLDVIGEQKTGGTSDNLIDWNSIMVVDEAGNDVTDNYTFSVFYGTLSII